jgi:ribosomal protein S18 acetylase RimI-like enzyme
VLDDVAFAVVGAADAGEVLTLQRAAYVTEAQLYDDLRLPPLTQSLDELRAELAQGLAFKAVARNGRVVGAVRAAVQASTLHVGRLTVAPDQQGRGIGSALLRHVERAAPPGTEKYALFTGHLSQANIRLYERHGYREARREPLHAGVTLVHLEKAA